MINIFDLCTHQGKNEDGDEVFVVDPDIMYPAMLPHVQDALGRARPNSALGLYWSAGKRLNLTDADFGLAAFPYSELADADDGADDAARWRRDAVLELCRLWFTELLHVNINQAGMNLFIRKHDDNSWQLFHRDIDVIYGQPPSRSSTTP